MMGIGIASVFLAIAANAAASILLKYASIRLTTVAPSLIDAPYLGRISAALV